jgi:hypothetical protein
MSRFSVLISKPWRMLGALGLLLAAVALAIGSGADFTASSANPSNTFATGSLSMSNSNSAASILTASNMKPGDSTSGTVDIANTGSVDGVFSVAEGNTTGSSALAGELNLVVVDCGAFTQTTTFDDTAPSCSSGTTQIYSGTLSGASVGSSTVNQAASNTAGDKHRYQFTVSLPANASNTFAGLSTSADFTWSAHS